MNNNKIYITGNNDGNFVEIKQLDDNMIHLIVGDCCVHTINVKITAEALSNFLTNLTLNANKSFLKLVSENLTWNEEYNKEVLSKCIEKI